MKMTKFQLLSSVILIIISQFAKGEEFSNRLALQWPPATCQFLGDGCNKNLVKSLTDFSLHGLWPQKPEKYNCKGNKQLDVRSLLQDQKQDLETMWPTLDNHGNEGFWNHEWRTHGACTEPLMAFKDYFTKTTALFRGMKQETALQMLQAAGITPGNRYSYDDLIPKMNLVKHKPAIACKKLNNDQMIAEVIFCVNPAGTEIIECGTAAVDANCNLDKVFIFPK